MILLSSFSFLPASYQTMARTKEQKKEIVAKLEGISSKIDAQSESAERWLPEDIAIAGAVVGMGYNGELAVERGLVKPGDRPVRANNDNLSAERPVQPNICPASRGGHSPCGFVGPQTLLLLSDWDHVPIA